MVRNIRTGLGPVLFYGAIGADFLLFRLFADTNYFLWYLSQGPFVSLSTALLSTWVNDLDRDTELVSAHPRYYYAGCLWVVIMVTSSARTNLVKLLRPSSDDTARDASVSSALWFICNTFLGLLVTCLLGLIVFLWFVIIAPIQYFVFLIAGAPVRMGLLGKPMYTIYAERYDPQRHGKVQVVEESEKLPKDALDITFTRKLITMTSVIAAILLWLANSTLALFT